MSGKPKTASEKRTEAFANQLIEAIENNTAPWLKPWGVGELLAHRPHNAVTGGFYNGVNRMILSSAGAAKGYKTGEWCTRLQAEKHNWRLKKDEQPTYICFFISPKDREEVANLPEEQAEKAMRGGMITFAVYNVEQFENRNRNLFETLDKLPSEHEIHERAEEILKESKADIRHSYVDRAFYSSTHDLIHLPEKKTFLSSGGYYATALHELGHWTGHPDRLDRKLGNKFGSQDYAREELRAEIASFMLSQEVGIEYDPSQHVSYIKSWVQYLRDHPKEILNACRDAEKIFQYIEQFDRHASKDRNADLKEHLENSREFVKNYDLRMEMPTEERAQLVIEIAENTEVVSDYKSVSRALRDETGFSQFTMKSLQHVAEARNYDEKMRLAMIITPTNEQLGKRLIGNSKTAEAENTPIEAQPTHPMDKYLAEFSSNVKDFLDTVRHPLFKEMGDREKAEKYLASYLTENIHKDGTILDNLRSDIAQAQAENPAIEPLNMDTYLEKIGEILQEHNIAIADDKIAWVHRTESYFMAVDKTEAIVSGFDLNPKPPKENTAEKSIDNSVAR